MAHRINPREPKLPKKPNTIGRPLPPRISSEAFHGKFPRVRLQLRPEDVLGQGGDSFSETATLVRKNRRS
jgi:hypothetical protein